MQKGRPVGQAPSVGADARVLTQAYPAVTFRGKNRDIPSKIELSAALVRPDLDLVRPVASLISA